MAEGQHSVVLAAIAVAGTITVATVVTQQWVLPTSLASANHQIDLLKEQLANSSQENSQLTNEVAVLSQKTSEQEIEIQRLNSEFISTTQRFNEKLFAIERTNLFVSGSPYPVGFDKISVGDTLDTVKEIYPTATSSESGRTLYLEDADPIFWMVSFTHTPFDKDNPNVVNSIRYSLGRIHRITDHTLPEVPKNWLDETLVRILGKPIMVGFDDNCMLWKHADDRVVYHVEGEDWFSIDDLSSYPSECNFSEEQFSREQADEQNQ